jgi:hypothetical protein
VVGVQILGRVWWAAVFGVVAAVLLVVLAVGEAAYWVLWCALRVVLVLRVVRRRVVVSVFGRRGRDGRFR